MKGLLYFILFIFMSAFVNAAPSANKPLIEFKPKARVIPKQASVSALDLALIQPYLSQNLIVSLDWFDAQPLIIGSDDISGLYRERDVIYINGILPEGALLGIYQKGREFDLASPQYIEQEILLAASGLVIESNYISKVKVLSSFKEVQLGDRVLMRGSPLLMSAYFTPTMTRLNTIAFIMASATEATAMGAMDVVYVNQGKSQGLEVGHLLSIFGDGDPVTLTEEGVPVMLSEGTAFDNMMANFNWDPVFITPQVYHGELMIFKVFEEMSFGIIMENERPIRVGDSVGL
ncbi:peptidoglycan-binding protein LysM [Shewanella surugensis]|uniref:Peptidoglycan-binding protein LysM n=1 Tax=Shewanella surugensis TaxID=212020 RepID=A0ABT0LH01_9GAMM|nr:peptidoglycan-binding protein LysM [Shewanella surugensis]MCL1126988.1 peptidoglycan-binding protein LysM [Shewanella surugensis]